MTAQSAKNSIAKAAGSNPTDTAARASNAAIPIGITTKGHAMAMAKVMGVSLRCCWAAGFMN